MGQKQSSSRWGASADEFQDGNLEVALREQHHGRPLPLTAPPSPLSSSSFRHSNHHRHAAGIQAGFKAIDATNIRKLRKALKHASGTMTSIVTDRLQSHHQPDVGSGQVGAVIFEPPGADEDGTRPLSLLEYAVEKNFYPGVEMMLRLATEGAQYREDTQSIRAAFLRSCDGGYLRLGIFNLFVDAAISGQIKLDLHDAYIRLIDHFMYRKPYELVRRPCFDVAALQTTDCRVSPLGLAVINDDPDTIESFVRRGADVNGYDRDGNTALLRAGYGLKKSCFIKLLLLGADPNLRSIKRPGATMFRFSESVSPLIATCLAFNKSNQSRSDFVAALISCGFDPTPDRLWFSTADSSFIRSSLVRRLEDHVRQQVIELCGEPRRLDSLCLSAIRRQLSRCQHGGVEKNAGQLPLPSSIIRRLKLEDLDTFFD